MATKSNIITLIQSFLTGNSSKTTWEEHEDILFDETDSILGELYKTTSITDTNASTNVFTEIDSDIIYNLKVKKQGGLVNVKGTIRNNTGSVLRAFESILEVTNLEYVPVDFGLVNTNTINGEIINLSLAVPSSGDTRLITLANNFFNGETLLININYYVGQ